MTSQKSLSSLMLSEAPPFQEKGYSKEALPMAVQLPKYLPLTRCYRSIALAVERMKYLHWKRTKLPWRCKRKGLKGDAERTISKKQRVG